MGLIPVIILFKKCLRSIAQQYVLPSSIHSPLLITDGVQLNLKPGLDFLQIIIINVCKYASWVYDLLDVMQISFETLKFQMLTTRSSRLA